MAVRDPLHGEHARGGTGPVRPAAAHLLAALLALSASCALAGCRDRAASAASADRMKDFYALREVPRFELTLSPEARASLAEEPREWVRARFRYRDEVLEDVAVKLKGHRSMRRLADQKPSFKVRFDKFVKKRRFLGQRSLTLNAMVEDPTMVREALGYRLFREAGVPAPETGYAEVLVDGEPYGLYLLVESIDRPFLERRFGNHDGELYEGEYGCDLYPEDVAGLEQEEGPADRPGLTALAEVAAGPVDRLIAGPEARFDDSALAYLAVSAVIGDFDGYRHAHNYRLYLEPEKDRWFFIPWGIDRTFRQRLDPLDSNGLVARRCFRDHACRLAYLRAVRRVLAVMDRLHLDRGLEVLGAVAARVEDPRRPYDAARTRRARAELGAFLAGRAEDLADELACLDGDREIDLDGDGAGCMDCDDGDPAVRPGAVEICNGRDDDCSGVIDDSPACPCEQVDIDGVAFELCDRPMPWDEAAAFCAARGGALARVDDRAQSEALHRAARRLDRTDRWWIGLSDRGAEGDFRWMDGTPVGEEALWASGEPDEDACSQDCAALKKGGDGRWHDSHCGQPRPFICRMPAR